MTSQAWPSLAAVWGALLILCGTAAAADLAGDARLGVCTHYGQGWDPRTLMPLVAASGLGWIRDEVWWENVERTKGRYTLAPQTLAWVRATHANHLRLLLILNGCNRLYADPYNPAAYAAWATWMARQLGPDIDAIEVLNEPNNFGFSNAYGGGHDGEGDSPWVARYVTLLNSAAAAIKAIDPHLPVVGLGAGMPVSYRQLAIGIAPAVDGITDHPYSNQLVPELLPISAAADRVKFGTAFSDDRGTFASYVAAVRQQSADRHGPRQLWLTEWGVSTYQPLGPAQFGGFTEAAQAAYIARRFVEGLALGVDVSILYEFRDGAGPHDAEDRWGLVRADGSAKPSFAAVVHLTATVRHLRAVRAQRPRLTVFPAACWPAQAPVAVYDFVDDGGRPAAAIWATDPAGGDRQPRVGDVELRWPAGVRTVAAVDALTGERRPLDARREGGRLVVRAMDLPDHPVFLEAGDTGGADAADTAPVNLDLFRPAHPWQFGNGQEFPGAIGNFALSTDGDCPIGTLRYDFAHGGAYVSAETPVGIPNTAAEFRIAARADQPLRVALRLVDASGQCHQYVKPIAGTGAWEPLRVRLDAASPEHWAGRNDGRVHFPVVSLALCAQAPAGTKAGRVAFADVETVGR